MSVPSWWDQLMAASDALAAVDRAQVGDWDRGNEGIREQVLRNEPDTPEEELPEMDDLPFLVRLGGLGSALATSPDITDDERIRALSVVEDALDKGDEVEQNAIVTGFLEAMLNQRDKFDLRRLWPSLGPLTRQSCVDLENFWTNQAPDWMTLSE